jgi:hypothetical protein
MCIIPTLICRPEDGPAPGLRITGVPDGFQAPPIPEKLIEIEASCPVIPGFLQTRRYPRQQLYRHADLRGRDGSALAMLSDESRRQSLRYTYDHNKPASDALTSNSLVGMFFHVNWLRPMYEAGFDEASGNAQQDNFGRGGMGSDPILAEGDFSGTDNANMRTPPTAQSQNADMIHGPQPATQPHQQP